MMRCFWLFCVIIFCFGCKQKMAEKQPQQDIRNNFTQRIYSKNVGDSFSAFIHLPNDYDTSGKKKYPVVFVLDANLYADIFQVTLSKYEPVGLLPSVILVGIGYKDFAAMDSLRERDDTYPVAMPEYEMKNSGGADKFLQFINNELVPLVDSRYKTDTLHRVLFGHSLSGYFVAYALHQNLQNHNPVFTHYIAASPSLNYNKYYLMNQMNQLQPGNQKADCYLTFGGLEDEEDKDEPGMIKVETLTTQWRELMQQKRVKCKSVVYSNLAHMDTPIPSFIKGLQWSLMNDRQ